MRDCTDQAMWLAIAAALVLLFLLPGCQTAQPADGVTVLMELPDGYSPVGLPASQTPEITLVGQEPARGL